MLIHMNWCHSPFHWRIFLLTWMLVNTETQLDTVQRISYCGPFCTKWDNCITPLPKVRKRHGKVKKRLSKSQRPVLTAVRQCLLGITWLLYSRTHCHCCFLHRTTSLPVTVPSPIRDEVMMAHLSLRASRLKQKCHIKNRGRLLRRRASSADREDERGWEDGRLPKLCNI